MTDHLSVPKRLLHRFHVQAPLPFRKRRGHKLVIRLGQDSKASTLEKRPEWELPTGKNSQSQRPTSVPPKKRRRRRRDPNNILPNTTLQKPNARSREKRRRFWRWSLLWLSILSILGISVTSGVLLLTKLPPPVDCQRLSPLASDSDHLYCAQRAAASGKLEALVAAIKLVDNWTADHPLYSEAQHQLRGWSEAILELAQQKIKQGDHLGAMKIAQQIPSNSPIYPKAKAAIATWQDQWQQGQETIRKFKAALVGQNWFRASQLIGLLSQSDRSYWNASRLQTLMKQLASEKLAWEQLEEARNLAKTNRLTQLQEAIVLVSKINPNSYVKAQAEREQTRWSRTLVQLAAISFKNQDFPGIVKMLAWIPPNTSLYQEAQDWILLARASQTAKDNNIVAWVDALAGVRQIRPDSPVHQLALQQATLWESQLQDSTQLQIARLTASLGQPMALTYAIDRAQQVAPKHPQRLLAQTLIAQWRKEIQQIENQHKLMEAQHLAAQGRIEQLKAAVEIASSIQLGQPLRLEAQSVIARWNGQIQTIEDQPIMELAQTLAQRQDFTAAISTAGQIRSGRALYAEAQRAIADWVVQVQTAQDRPILEAATALATQGRFDAAIATAAQIPPERALYQQAQSAIAEWTSQKAALSGDPPLDDPTLGLSNENGSADIFPSPLAPNP